MNFRSRFSALMATAFIVAVAPFAHANEIQIFPPVVEGTTNTVCPSGARAPLTWDGQSNVTCAQGLTITGGNVGIGTTNPLSPLHVVSGELNDNMTGILVESHSTSQGSPRIGFVDTDLGPDTLAPAWYVDNLQDRFRIFRQPNIFTPGWEGMTITNAGFVGMGTPAPEARLDLTAPVDPATGLVSGAAFHIYYGNFGNGPGGINEGGNIWMGAAGDFLFDGGTDSNFWFMNTGSIAGATAFWWQGDATHPAQPTLYMENAGNVGIGTSAPESLLDVNGVVTARGPLVTTQVATGYPPIFPLAYFDEYDSLNGGPGYARIASVGRTPSVRGGFLLYSGSSDNSNVTIPYMTVPNGSQDYTGINIPVGNSPSYALDVNGIVHASNFIQTSDRRHKTDIEPLAVNALDTVAKLKPVTFMWKDPPDDGMKSREIGFIAQDVQEVVPEAILTANDPDKTLGLKYDSLIPVLTKAIQELKTDDDDLRAANEADAAQLKNAAAEFKDLASRIDALEAERR